MSAGSIRRVFITGASGFIGRVLGDVWRTRDVEVVGVDRTADPERGVVAGDISQPGEWQRAAAGCDVVIHTAALVGMPSDVSGFWGVNVRGTRLALEAARDAGAGRFLHVSSVVTFGLDFPDGVDERWPVRPTGVAYVDTKIASEQVALQAHAAGEVSVTVVRPGDVYGPGSRPWTLLPVELIRTGRFVLPARGRGIHSPVYVDDLVRGMVGAAEEEGASGRVITLSGGVGIEMRDFFGHYARMLGRRGVPTLPTSMALAGAVVQDRVARIRRTPNEVTPAGVRYLGLRRGTYGIATARELFGWSPTVGLERAWRGPRPGCAARACCKKAAGGAVPARPLGAGGTSRSWTRHSPAPCSSMPRCTSRASTR